MSFGGAVYIAVVAVVWARQQCKRAEVARDIALDALSTIYAIRSTPRS